MLFHSGSFVGDFLLPVLALFFIASRLAGIRAALWVLIASSLVFYGWSHPVHLLVLAASVIANYGAAGGIIAWRGTHRGKALLIAAVALNLSVLAYFKYALFVRDLLPATVAGMFSPAAVLLPLGISFFTFQKIAYVVDAWRGRFSSQTFPEFLLFVVFFPQLIAGPIVHHTEFFPQLTGGGFGQWNSSRMVAGASLFAIGCGKKILLADSFAPHATEVFGHFSAGVHTGMLEAWGGLAAFSLQIYFDFAAYSDMAIGLALLFGITLPENFAAPYRATSLIEFWRRWHMTLSRFLRDYLYVPLGGNRHGLHRQMAALMVTMLLGGLWHGASWMFVMWGVVHGVALAVNHGWRRLDWSLPSAVGWLLTAFVVATAWVFFRADNLPAAVHGLRALVGLDGWWPAGSRNMDEWIRSLPLSSRALEFRDVLGYWGVSVVQPHVAFDPVRWIFTEGATRLVLLLIGLLVVTFETPAARVLWNFGTNEPRLTPRMAWTVGAVLVLVLIASVSAVPSSFIYFRF